MNKKLYLFVVLFVAYQPLFSQISIRDIRYSIVNHAARNDNFSLLQDSTNSNDYRSASSKTKQWVKASIVPAGLITAGLVMTAVPSNTLLSKHSVKERIQESFPGFSTEADDFLQFAPGIALIGLKTAGVKSRSDLLNQGIILVKSQLLQMVIVKSLKEILDVERPNGMGDNSMPSGHTAEAFQLAAMLDIEYREVSPWISAGGYLTAAATGALRMLNNKHWDSDVMIGAAIGILSTKAVYLTHRYRWEKNNNIVLLPAVYRNGGGIIFAMQL